MKNNERIVKDLIEIKSLLEERGLKETLELRRLNDIIKDMEDNL